jgi:hypothetical protein
MFTIYLSLWYLITSRQPLGTNVFESDWDLLIVLDACRVDTLREVGEEYEFIEFVGERWSVGSQSMEWLASTFTPAHKEKIQETHYLSSNGYSEVVLNKGSYPPANNTIPIDLSSWDVVNDDILAAHETVWKDHHDDTYGVVLPEVMTDHAISTCRKENPDRMIVHYTQPHLPYAGQAYQEGCPPTELEERGYELLEEGNASKEEVYIAYKETLRWVLDDVEELLQNVNAGKAVITSDHGEAFGEWKAYGHPEGFPHPAVKKVPWVETTATDQRTREPQFDTERSVETDIEQHLEDLGYR